MDVPSLRIVLYMLILLWEQELKITKKTFLNFLSAFQNMVHFIHLAEQTCPEQIGYIFPQHVKD